METGKWYVVYEETSSGVPEGTRVVASYDTEGAAIDEAVQRNTSDGYDGLTFEGAGDVRGYYVRRNLGSIAGQPEASGQSEEIDSSEVPDDFCELCGFPPQSSYCCHKSAAHEK